MSSFKPSEFSVLPYSDVSALGDAGGAGAPKTWPTTTATSVVVKDGSWSYVATADGAIALVKLPSVPKWAKTMTVKNVPVFGTWTGPVAPKGTSAWNAIVAKFGTQLGFQAPAVATAAKAVAVAAEPSLPVPVQGPAGPAEGPSVTEQPWFWPVAGIVAVGGTLAAVTWWKSR